MITLLDDNNAISANFDGKEIVALAIILKFIESDDEELILDLKNKIRKFLPECVKTNINNIPIANSEKISGNFIVNKTIDATTPTVEQLLKKQGFIVNKKGHYDTIIGKCILRISSNGQEISIIYNNCELILHSIPINKTVKTEKDIIDLVNLFNKN